MGSWDAFHDAFQTAFGFPSFYGRNMDAWIDCMFSLHEPADGMTTVHGTVDDPVVLEVETAEDLPQDIHDALLESAAFVNWRNLQAGEPAVLVLALNPKRRPPMG